MELSALKLWLVRPANVSDYTVTVCGSHVKLVLTRSDGADLDAGLFLDLFWARRDVEGEGKSCRPPLSISHVPPLTLPTDFSFIQRDTLTFRKKKQKLRG